ncbi:hypothetical protein [Lacticaseibacillus zhaodongensis]|uniref:hypothetical protein n=1 Tax=Lacticaseibacillus zhaodongensis TaxID=2668065 RepID=UPI0012D3510B|nr:hypothetical protein [Lacticaseibacillus zhaodongensis]
MPESRTARRKQRKTTPRKRNPITPRTAKARFGHPGQRRFVSFLLTLVAIIGIGIAGLQATALNANFTTKTLTTGDNLTTIEQKVQSTAGSSLTNIPGASTLVSRAISEATTKAVVTAAVTDIYDNTTAQIDFTALDNTVRTALSSSTSGLSATLGSSIANSILPTLHNYLSSQLSTQTAKAKQAYQQASSAIASAVMPLTIIAAVLAIWLLLVAGGFGRFLHSLGWIGIFAGVLGTAGVQVAAKMPEITSLAASAGDLRNVVLDYVATVVNHMSGYYLITAGAGLILLLITIPIMRRR